MASTGFFDFPVSEVKEIAVDDGTCSHFYEKYVSPYNDASLLKCSRCGHQAEQLSLLPSLTIETEQPPPQPPADPSAPAVWDLVKFDMEARDATGLRRYGTRLRPGNGRDALKDAYEEALDLVVYLRQAIYERDGH